MANASKSKSKHSVSTHRKQKISKNAAKNKVNLKQSIPLRRSSRLNPSLANNEDVSFKSATVNFASATSKKVANEIQTLPAAPSQELQVLNDTSEKSTKTAGDRKTSARDGIFKKLKRIGNADEERSEEPKHIEALKSNTTVETTETPLSKESIKQSQTIPDQVDELQFETCTASAQNRKSALNNSMAAKALPTASTIAGDDTSTILNHRISPSVSVFGQRPSQRFPLSGSPLQSKRYAVTSAAGSYPPSSLGVREEVRQNFFPLSDTQRRQPLRYPFSKGFTPKNVDLPQVDGSKTTASNACQNKSLSPGNRENLPPTSAKFMLTPSRLNTNTKSPLPPFPSSSSVIKSPFRSLSPKRMPPPQDASTELTPLARSKESSSMPKMLSTSASLSQEYSPFSEKGEMRTQSPFSKKHLYTSKFPSSPRTPPVYSFQRKVDGTDSPSKNGFSESLSPSISNKHAFLKRSSPSISTPTKASTLPDPATITKPLGEASISEEARQLMGDAFHLCSEMQLFPENPLPCGILPPLTRNLAIGGRLLQLEKTYICLRSSLDHCYRCNKTPAFQYLKPIVEKLNNRRQFTLQTLQHLCWFVPSLLSIQWIRDESVGSNAIASLKYDVEIVERHHETRRPFLHVDDHERNLNYLKIFRSACIRWVARFHEEYLLRKQPPIRPPVLSSLTAWHDEFDPDSTPLPPMMVLESLKDFVAHTPPRSRSTSPVTLRNGTTRSPLLSRLTRHTPSPVRTESPFAKSKYSPLDKNETPSIITPRKYRTLERRPSSPLRSRTPTPPSSMNSTHVKNHPLSQLSPTKTLTENPGDINARKYISAEGLSRIKEKVKRTERAEAINSALRGRDEELFTKYDFWNNALWIFERMMQDFVFSSKYPISKLSVLCQKYSTAYTRSLQFEQVKETILVLQKLLPETVTSFSALGEENETNIKFELTSNLDEAIERIQRHIRAAYADLTQARLSRQADFQLRWTEEESEEMDTPIREAIKSPCLLQQSQSIPSGQRYDEVSESKLPMNSKLESEKFENFASHQEAV